MFYIVLEWLAIVPSIIVGEYIATFKHEANKFVSMAVL